VIALVPAILLAAVAIGLLIVHQRRMVAELNQLNRRLGEEPTTRPAHAVALLERSVDRVMRNEDDIEVARRRLERALSAMTQGAVVADRDGQVVLRNSFAESFVEARHGDALVESAIRELITNALRGEVSDREIVLFGPPKRTMLVHASPLVNETGIIGAIAVIDDITEQQRIDAIRRDFVANISHELKTPIGALVVLADALIDENDPAVIQRLAARMREEGFRVNRIVDDLLVLSRIEGEGLVDRERVCVADVVSSAVDRVRAAADKHQISINVAPIDHSVTLVGDRRQLTSALFNLLDNAIKYSEPRSPVQVRVANTTDEVSLVVQDHGIGIPAKDLDRIFERFYRVDQGRSRETGGTGLGLSIVRHVVRNHGGEVSVISREGEGSTFTLILPTHLTAETPVETAR
jgi:two-component system, OmpR family, sensor histidine kinase SenX3